MTFPRPSKAANDDVAPTTSAPKVTSGWDAYEVWLTRIKAMQDRPDRTTPRG